MSKYREQFEKEFKVSLEVGNIYDANNYVEWLESKLKEAEEIHTRDMGVIELLKSTLNGFNKLRQ